MTDETPFTEHHHAHVVVHPLVTQGAPRPFRRVDILGTHVGDAYSLGDVAEFCRRAGLYELDLESRSMVEWQGGGPDVWE
ncbi:hypothetical protein [Streptacidiphilus sp. MAP5-3]|uniref:hypothetical protein n=1 Tax=unclassified Streptacidiphilus TaxID=2643834 RepID=UPI0035144BA3